VNVFVVVTPGVYSEDQWNQDGIMTIDMGPGSTGAPIIFILCSPEEGDISP
jgi:hypothetical protein